MGIWSAWEVNVSIVYIHMGCLGAWGALDTWVVSVSIVYISGGCHGCMGYMGGKCEHCPHSRRESWGHRVHGW